MDQKKDAAGFMVLSDSVTKKMDREERKYQEAMVICVQGIGASLNKSTEAWDRVDGLGQSHHDALRNAKWEMWGKDSLTNSVPSVQPWASVIQQTLSHQNVPEYFQKDDTMKYSAEILEEEEVLQTTTCTPRDIYTDSKGWTTAFEVELFSFQTLDVKMDVREDTLDLRRVTILPGKTVMVKKPNGDGTHKKKARVVVCGNFQQVQRGEETCANTPSFPMLRVLVSLASLHGWSVASWDVSTAFLYASLPEGQDVYCRPPNVLVRSALVEPGIVWKLKKALYGLKTSPKAWEEERDQKLGQLQWDTPQGRVGLVKIESASCVWMIQALDDKTCSNPLGMVIAYVDDIIAVGEQEQLDGMKAELDKLYVMKTSGFIPSNYDPEVEPLRFLGCVIERIPSGQIVMHQRSYIDHCLKANDMEKLKGLTTLPAVDERSPPEEEVDENGQTTDYEEHKSWCQKYIGQFMKNGSDSVLRHRVIRGRRAFAVLHQWWRMPLSLALKIRLFQSMVVPVYLYGVNAVGLSVTGSSLLKKDLMRCLRRIARSPVHITRESDQKLLDRLHLQNPLLRVHVSCCQLLRRMLVTLPAEVCPCSQLEHMMQTHRQLTSCWWNSLIAGLKLLFPQLPSEITCLSVRNMLLSVAQYKIRCAFATVPKANLTPPPVPLASPVAESFTCEGCSKKFDSYNTLRTHQYRQMCAWSRIVAKYEPTIDNDTQDPVCAWCKRAFLWWSGLRLHIERGQCAHMERRAEFLQELSSRNAPHPNLHLDKDLTCHCVLCRRWIKLTRSLAAHLSRAHPKELAIAKSRYKKADFSSVSFRQQCPFCHLYMTDASNMRSHVRSHCLVLLQRFLAGCPNPLDPSHPGHPSSEHTASIADGHGEVSGEDTIVSTSKRRAASSVGSTLSASRKESQIRRRLRGKQRDPRCRREGGDQQHFQQAKCTTSAKQAESQAYTGPESWSSACWGGESSQVSGEACPAAARDNPASYESLRLSLAHGSRRGAGNGPKPCRGQQSAAAEEHPSNSCGSPGRAQSPEGWRSSLRLRAQQLAAVLRTGLGCHESMHDTSSRRQDLITGSSDETSRRTFCTHTHAEALERLKVLRPLQTISPHTVLPIPVVMNSVNQSGMLMWEKFHTLESMSCWALLDASLRRDKGKPSSLATQVMKQVYPQRSST